FWRITRGVRFDVPQAAGKTRQTEDLDGSLAARAPGRRFGMPNQRGAVVQELRQRKNGAGKIRNGFGLWQANKADSAFAWGNVCLERCLMGDFAGELGDMDVAGIWACPGTRWRTLDFPVANT
ncbi:MAG: hypothetical protein LBE06_04695, partial [Azoarcus sp.]|nr:hypothetical protein [Azoarcus sp.]